jgi:hypothetical protein
MTSSTGESNASMAGDCDVLEKCLTTNNHISLIYEAIILLRYGIPSPTVSLYDHRHFDDINRRTPAR